MTGRLDGAHHLRATPRFKVFQPTEMTVGCATTRVHLLNLSAGGALVHSEEPPAPGTRVRLRYGSDWRSGRVAWTVDRRFGIAFAVPLADAQVEQVIASQQAMVATARRIGAVARDG